MPFHKQTQESEREIMREVSAKLSRRHVVDIDPEDPTQQLDDTGEFHIEPLEVDVQPVMEASEDFDIASAENVLGESEAEEVTADADLWDETGALYGVRTPHAGDTDLSAAEDRDGFDGAWLGENWVEALQEHATLMGPAEEEEIVIVDNSDDEQTRPRGNHPIRRRVRSMA